jgi:cephalosporin-C deacetylase-like acetyl esterase
LTSTKSIHLDPEIRDHQHAVTYAQNRSEVEGGRIGVWRTSFSAAHAFVVAAIDRRVQAVCGQAPFISGRATYANLAAQQPGGGPRGVHRVTAR